MENSDKTTIKDRVEEAIARGKISMRPKWRFFLNAALLLAVTILAALAMLFLSSFIIFTLRQTGIWFAPGFGVRGFRLFLVSLPWMLLAVLLLFLMLVQILIKKYTFSYSRPLLYSGFGILVLSLIGGTLVAATPIHRGLFRRAKCSHLPLASGLYMQYANTANREIVPGEIVSIGERSYQIRIPSNEILSVTVTKQTRLPFGADFSAGDRIVVVGRKTGGYIESFGIRKIGGATSNSRPFTLPIPPDHPCVSKQP